MKKLVNNTTTPYGHKKVTIKSVKYNKEYEYYYITAYSRFNEWYAFSTEEKVNPGEKHIMAFDETADWAEIDDNFEITLQGEEE